MSLVYAYTAALVVFLLMDFVWLGVLAKSYYHAQLARVIEMKVRFGVAFVFYVLQVLGVMFFVVHPGMVGDAALWGVGVRGALFGFFTYATYHLTNMATLPRWPLGFALVDLGWGALLNSVVAIVGTWIGRL